MIKYTVLTLAAGKVRGLVFFATIALISVSLTQQVSAEIRWQRSIESTIESARTSRKPILVFVTTDWCHYCKKMKQETWSDPNVSAPVSQHFETLVLDGDRDRAIVTKMGLKSYPVTLLYTADGNFVDSQDGYMSTAKVIDWLGSQPR
ncbi:thioredoxin family protein [Novipirellula artificiosorum]|uniref:Thiol:disulfide interchange protein n=1 Tax=Novipirellula artificiosorum TaxID=2528016 RepID=A0A5C6DMY8_9BACT|nr:thioredoxin family protein [Novipirellula artificiosorum]TWU37217.1 thiol:disulfide interchange protein precursor [Novipirellula artificiosorum]